MSTWGKVYSSSRNKLLSQELTNSGYFRVGLINNDNKNTCSHVSVHRLVLSTFSPIKNMNLFQVNHKDGIKINNNLYNLEWTTQSENSQHALRNNLRTWRVGNDCSWRKINHEQADLIGKLLSTQKYTQKEISEIIGCSKEIVWYIANGFSWRDIYYKYNLRKFKHRLISNFSSEDLIKVQNYIKTNLFKYTNMDLRFLCMDLMKDLFDSVINKSIYVELMDIIADIQEDLI